MNHTRRSLALREIVHIGGRNVLRNLRRSLLTGSMVALGVTAIIFFRGYVGGLEAMMIDMVVNSLTGPIQIEREGYSDIKGRAPLELDLATDGDLIQRLTQNKEVTAVAPRVRFGAFLMLGDESTMVGVLGVDPQREKIACPKGPGAGYFNAEAQATDSGLQGASIAHRADDTLIVGAELAKGLGLKLGQTVTLLTETQAGSTNAVDGVIRGIFNSGDLETNKRLVMMSIGLAQTLLRMPDRATSLVIGLGADADIDEVAKTLNADLATEEPRVVARAWHAIAPYYRDSIVLQRDVLAIVMTIIFILAVVGIVNTMMMSVYERQREIGTLMAIGFRRKTIMALFVAEALALGVFAAILGVSVGIAIVSVTQATGIPFVAPGVGTILNHPIIDPEYTAMAATIAIAAALCAGIYPALKASRLTPVEAFHAI